MKKKYIIESAKHSGSFYSKGDIKFRAWVHSTKFDKKSDVMVDIEEACKIESCKIVEIFIID